jgi:hypothetical protein
VVRLKYPSVLRKNQAILSALAIFFAMAWGSLIIGCDKQDEIRPSRDHEYLPLRKGWYQVYDVEETVYELGTSQTYFYQLKTVIVDSFPNAEGAYTYLIHRSRKYSGNDLWEEDGTFTARLSDTEAIVSKGNTPFVVLTFPAATGNDWNGNAYNDEVNPNSNSASDLYEITQTGIGQVVNGVSFPDCITVVQEDNDDTIVFQDNRSEIYARNVGLIFREIIQLTYCNDEDRNCVGEQIIDEGIIYAQRISHYGLE